MKIDLNDKYEFIPEWNGNQEDENPIKVYCKHMTAGERERCITQDIISEEDGPKLNPARLAEIRTALERAQKELVTQATPQPDAEAEE